MSALRLRQRGAVLLILVGVLSMGAAAVFLSAANRNTLDLREQARTLVQLREAREAIFGFALTHGRLPRPAISASNGSESPTPCTTEESCSGWLPWVTLGITATDAWGKQLRYRATAVLTTAPVLRNSAVANKVIIGRDANGNEYFAEGETNCTLKHQCVAAVIVSFGKYNFGASEVGIAQVNASGSNADEMVNATSSTRFVRRQLSKDPYVRGGEYDDLVVSIGYDNLIARMNRSGVLP